MGEYSHIRTILETDERGHFIADAVSVEGDEQVGIQEQAVQHIDLHTDGAAERIERLAGKGDARVGWICRPTLGIHPR